MAARNQNLAPPELLIPESFRAAPPAAHARVCNGAGPAGWGWIVPDTIWGLDISLAADIHDWMYAHGTTEEDRRRADLTFLHNLLVLINADSMHGIVRCLRELRAFGYYLGVSWGGGFAFKKGKKKPNGCT